MLAPRGLYKWPTKDVGRFRRQFYQLTMFAALFCLLICDVVVGLLLNASSVTAGTWGAFIFIGLLYLLLIGLAHRIGFGPLPKKLAADNTA